MWDTVVPCFSAKSEICMWIGDHPKLTMHIFHQYWHKVHTKSIIDSFLLCWEIWSFTACSYYR